MGCVPAFPKDVRVLISPGAQHLPLAFSRHLHAQSKVSCGLCLRDLFPLPTVFSSISFFHFTEIRYFLSFVVHD